MKYIRNNLDYAVVFSLREGAKEKRFEFDCLRIYSDTGNVASSGVTAVDDMDFDKLYSSCRQFKSFVDKGVLSRTTREGANSVAGKIEVLEKENLKLKEELSRIQEGSEVETLRESNRKLTEELSRIQEGSEVETLRESNRKQEEEITDLKKKLEALSKGKRGRKETDTEED